MKNSLISIDIEKKQHLEALVRTTELQKKIVPYNSKIKSFTPYLEKGNIVLCDFIGFGKELDLPHYAVVWNSNGWNENINIIPLTSKFKPESKSTFWLGKIKNFMSKDEGIFINKDSYIYLNRLMEVSRLRVRLIYQEDTKGNKILDYKNRFIPVSLDEATMNTISNSIKLTYAGEGTCLVDLLLKYKPDTFIDLETLSDKNIFNIGYRLIDSYTQYSFGEENILIFFVDGIRYSLKIKNINWKRFNSEEHSKLYSTIKYHKNFGNRKRYITEALFSRDKLKVKEAKQLIKDLY
ncbi:type II toxin-antitoxin system PemK/MazF family toxin [Clostridium perfringens]|uniref:hypothetical protein n=1 Tax=Clostridium perfringens TaxID=1502 RepID=UPI00297A6C53|nr:type II toxin-antitoxin system PemK/MazF family toxin [Clostridium perfringens]MDM0871851.1 type II toxin-antitoxin system PemK/MazF family toxin [Clostridium perfringens]